MDINTGFRSNVCVAHFLIQTTLCVCEHSFAGHVGRQNCWWLAVVLSMVAVWRSSELAAWVPARPVPAEVL